MKKEIKINGETIELNFHFVDDEVSEVFAIWDGCEIALGFDEEDCIDKAKSYLGKG